MIKFTVPVKTVSPNRVRGNTRLAAIITSNRKKKERNAAKLCTMAAMAEAFGSRILSNGYIISGKDHVSVIFTRLSAGTLDAVNLAASLKAVEDGVAEAMKIDDGASCWRGVYEQRKVKRGEFGVEVSIS